MFATLSKRQLTLSLSALIGFGIMALLTPVPAYVGQLMASVQREKMKAVSPLLVTFPDTHHVSCITDR